METKTQETAGFFTEATLKAATMTDEQEGRAYRGYCPKCGEHKLKRAGSCGVGMVFKLCAACGAVAVFTA